MKVKGFIICELGLEDISVLELNELFKIKGKKVKGGVVFECPIQTLPLACYRMQSVKRVLWLLGDFTFGGFSEFKEKLKQVKFQAIGSKKIAVEGIRLGVHSFNSVQAAAEVTRLFGQNVQVDYNNPDVRFLVYVVDNHGYVGIDLSGFDCAKRDYKVFSHSASLKGTIAYGVVRLSGYKRGLFFLSCMDKSGMIALEAGLFASGKSVNHYRKEKFAFLKLEQFKNVDLTKIDQKLKKERIRAVNKDLRHVSAGKKNAKIAGMDNVIGFSRMDIDWLDVKYKEGEVDVLIAQPVASEIKTMPRFFEQAQYIVAEDGTVCVVSFGEGFNEMAMTYGFLVKEKRVLVRGQSIVRIEVFGKISETETKNFINTPP